MQPDFVTHTVDVIRFIAANVGGMIDVIQLMNEAGGFRSDVWARVIRQFWLDGYDAVQEAGLEGIHVMIGDAFLGVDVSAFL